MLSPPTARSRTLPSPLRTHRGDRWRDVSTAIALGLISLHHQAIAALATCHGWAGESDQEQKEDAVQFVLAGQPPRGWPLHLSPIRYSLTAVDSSTAIVATEHWMVDPSRIDLGVGSFDRLLRERLGGLPRPHEGSIAIHAESALHQRLLAQCRLSVAVGLPRQEPLPPKERVALAKVQTDRLRAQEQAMTAFLQSAPYIVSATATAIEASGGNSYPSPVGPNRERKPTEEEMDLVRAGAQLVMDHLFSPTPEPPAVTAGPTGPQRRRKRFDS